LTDAGRFIRRVTRIKLLF